MSERIEYVREKHASGGAVGRGGVALLLARIDELEARPTTPPLDVEPAPATARWACLDSETGEWLEVKPGTVWLAALANPTPEKENNDVP